MAPTSSSTSSSSKAKDSDRHPSSTDDDASSSNASKKALTTINTADIPESTNVAGTRLGSFRANPINFIIRLTAESSAFYQGAGWRSYQNYIGTRIFYKEYSLEIRSALMTSERVKKAVRTVAQKRIAMSQSATNATSTAVAKKGKKKTDPLPAAEGEVWTVAIRTIDKMVADMDTLNIIKFVAFTVNNILVRMYHQGIHIREAEFVELRKWAEMAEREQKSLIFLPCHKSHIDYLVISYIFFRLGLALPHIAAGDNLNLPIVGNLLKHSGAFFIKRVWGDDLLYNTIMREYIELLLNRGHNIEAFIEGTRSRIGKLLQPKFGILKIILESILSGRVRDAIIVPMSIGYDKVIETEGYVRELLGTPKEKESLYQLLNNANILQFKWGRIDIRFAKPFSLKEYCATESVRRGPEFDPGEKIEDRNLLLQTLGYHVLSDINAVSVVMPTALVGTVILTLRGRGVGRDELIRKVSWLKRTVTLKGGNVADFGGKSVTWVVDRAIQVLRDLIGQRQDLLEPVYYPVKRFELSFYRNQVIHLFINEAILSTAMYATVKAGGPVHNQRILVYPNLENDVSFISQLLKSEFIYGPGGLRDNLAKTIEMMTSQGVFVIQDDFNTDGSPTGKRWMTLSPEERRIGRETFDFYCFLLWPFLETYWLCAIACFALIPTDAAATPPDSNGLTWFDDRVFTNRSQFFGKTLYYEGDLSYLDAVNKETMKNGFVRLREMGVITYRKGTASGTGGKGAENVTYVALCKEWLPTKPLPPPPAVASFKNGRKSNKVKAGPTAVPVQEGQSTSVSSFALRHNNHQFTADQVKRSVATQSADDGRTPSAASSSNSHKRQRLPSLVDGAASGSDEDDDDDDDDDAASDESHFATWQQHTPEGALWDLCEQIGRFRREGKNRRDTSTVAIRVMRLARLTGLLVAQEGSDVGVGGRGFFGKKGKSSPPVAAGVADLSKDASNPTGKVKGGPAKL